MIKAMGITLLMAALILCTCGLIQEWKQVQQKRRERAERKRYKKRFLENQRECDEMFRERERDEQEAERKRKKWDKQSFTSHNPALEVFMNGVVI